MISEGYEFNRGKQASGLNKATEDRYSVNQLIEWHLDGKKPEIQWEGNFTSEILFRIAKDYPQNVFIGIRGGEKHLRYMAKNSPELVKGKSWQIGSHQPTSQWIPGDVFYGILADNNIY